MSLCSSGHRCLRDSHGLWSPQVWAQRGGARLDIETPLYPDPQSSPLCSACPPESSASTSLPCCPSSTSLPALSQGLRLCLR